MSPQNVAAAIIIALVLVGGAIALHVVNTDHTRKTVPARTASD